MFFYSSMPIDTRDKNFYFAELNYFESYANTIAASLKGVDRAALLRASIQLNIVRDEGARVFVAGNGGSAAIADHLECDFLKGCRHKTKTLNTKSLVSNGSLVTAIANDLGYDQVFRFQLEVADVRPGEILLLISSSGNSENIIQAAKFGLEHEMFIIGMTGFDGGRLKDMATASLHINFNNYGIIEDCHQAIMHIMAQTHYLENCQAKPD